MPIPLAHEATDIVEQKSDSGCVSDSVRALRLKFHLANTTRPLPYSPPNNFAFIVWRLFSVLCQIVCVVRIKDGVIRSRM